MIVILDELRKIADDMAMPLYHGEDALVEVMAQEQSTWPLIVVDTVDSRTPEITMQSTIQYDWGIDVFFFDEDQPESNQSADNPTEKDNKLTPSYTIITQQRAKAEDFMHRLLNAVDTNGRKLFLEVTGDADETRVKIGNRVVTGVMQSLHLKPIEKSILC